MLMLKGVIMSQSDVGGLMTQNIYDHGLNQRRVGLTSEKLFRSERPKVYCSET